ncbi:MAG: response regulator [Candidatus Rokubacteria bacterium]|nr:response regulator [Candidatus Rokubacteria bacterium]
MLQLTGIIGRQAAHLTRLVDDLLDVARVTSGKIAIQPRVVDLHDLAARSIDALAQAGRTATHDVAVEGASVHVHADPARLEQVLGNLVDNALKYTPPGGRVRVVTRREGNDAVLIVRDTGEGIPADILGRVFDLFVQEPQALDRSRGGLGLGLTVVKRLVELHGGSVAAFSAGRGLGSEFTVRLPATSAAERGTAAETVGGPPAACRPRHVLVVEDNADARESLRVLLSLSGHEVETAADAAQAIEKFGAFRPEVALVDIGLPGTDGYALARTLRQTGRAEGVRLVALTGYGQREDRQQALDAGFDLHLTKPVDPDQLARALA